MLRAVLIAAVLTTGAPVAAEGAAWDASPIDLTAGVDDYQYEPNSVRVTATADGALWTSWFEQTPTNTGSYVVRRIAPDGTPGERRVFAGGGVANFYANDVLAVTGPDTVRVAYLTGPGPAKLELRTLTPGATGDAVVLYDAAQAVNGGRVLPETVRLLPAGPGSWAMWTREEDNNAIFDSEARLVDGAGQPGAVAPLTTADLGNDDAAVDADGNLIAVLAKGGPGRLAAVKVTSDGNVGSDAEINPAETPGSIAEEPRIVISGDEATIAWTHNTTASGRRLWVRRLTPSTMTPQGSAPTPLDDGLPTDYGQNTATLGVDTSGTVLLGWGETDSSNSDFLVRRLAAGDLTAQGAIGDRIQLDGPPPDNAWPRDIVPAGNGAFMVSWYGTNGCSASLIAADDSVTSSHSFGTSCGPPDLPNPGAAAIAAAWYTNSPYRAQVARYVTDPPACANGSPVTVDHGAAATLPLSCSGWRAVPEIVGSPALGSLAPIDLAASTVAYTARADAAGADQVSYRASNAAGPGPTATIPLTVTGAAPPGPPPVDNTDRTAPTLSKLRLRPNRLAHGARRALRATFTLSETARVTVTLTRRHGKRTTRVRRVTKALAQGTRTLALLSAGRTRRLAPGRYRVTIVAVDAAGNRSAALGATLRITR